MTAPTTFFLISLNTAIFFTGVFTNSHAQLLSIYGFSLQQLVQQPEILVTSGFLHTDLPHLVYNMVFLGIFGVACEEEFGSIRTFGIYAAGLLTGNVFFALLFPASSAVGASGAVFALMGAGMLVVPGRPVLERVPLPIGLLAVVYLLPAVGNAFNVAGGVANIAHVGGAIAGALLAFYWAPEQARKGVWAVIGFTLLILAFGYRAG